MEHTKTPWKVGEYNEDYEEINILCVSDGYTYHAANVPVFQGAPSDEQKANAAFIVRACNNFDALVEALKEATIDYQTQKNWDSARGKDDYPDAAWYVKARAALEAAKE